MSKQPKVAFIGVVHLKCAGGIARAQRLGDLLPVGFVPQLNKAQVRRYWFEQVGLLPGDPFLVDNAVIPQVRTLCQVELPVTSPAKSSRSSL